MFFLLTNGSISTLTVPFSVVMWGILSLWRSRFIHYNQSAY